MVLKMKNFNILGVHWKVQLLGGFMKNQYRGWDCLKRWGLDSLSIYKGGLSKKEGGGVFEGGWYPNAHYESGAKFEEKLIFCFKNDKNLLNFDLSTKKSKKFALWLVPFVQSIQRLT